MRNKRDIEEDEDFDYNIQQISKVGYLSPRHTNSLKYGARKGRPDTITGQNKEQQGQVFRH